MKTPQTNDSLAKAIAYLGAAEVARWTYAFQVEPEGPQRWITAHEVDVAALGVLDNPGAVLHDWIAMFCTVMPAWWSPSQRFAWRDKHDGTVLPNDGLAPSADSLAAIRPEHYERITADLTTGAEVPA